MARRAAAVVRSLGVVGTAKNTGKTTTLIGICRILLDHDIRFVLTSIGYDGESTDSLTLLPKPRYTLPVETLVVTAEQCLGAGSAVLKKVEPLELQTALGRLWLAVVKRQGTVVVAGPNSGPALVDVQEELQERGPWVMLVDGSFGRLTPVMELDRLVLCTGAARNADVKQLADEARDLEQLFTLPVYPGPELHTGPDWEPTIALWRTEGSGARLVSAGSVGPNLIVGEQVAQLAAEIAGTTDWDLLFLPGAVDPGLLRELLQRLGEVLGTRRAVLFEDPSKLLSCAGARQIVRVLQQLVAEQYELLVRRALRLSWLTVNPFFPRLRGTDGGYRADYLDPKTLLDAVGAAVTVPVVDVVAQPKKLEALVVELFALGSAGQSRQEPDRDSQA